MYSTSGGAPGGKSKVLQVENPYFDAAAQQPRNTVQLRPQKLQAPEPAKPAPMPLKMPRHTGGTSLETLLRPSGLQNMNATQQYNKLVSMRAELAQRNREDNAMREFQRMAGAGAPGAVMAEVTARQRRDLEMSDILLQERPFTPDPAGAGYMVSGAERAGAMTQARRGAARGGGGGGGGGLPAGVPPVAGPRLRRAVGLVTRAFGATPAA